MLRIFINFNFRNGQISVSKEKEIVLQGLADNFADDCSKVLKSALREKDLIDNFKIDVQPVKLSIFIKDEESAITPFRHTITLESQDGRNIDFTEIFEREEIDRLFNSIENQSLSQLNEQLKKEQTEQCVIRFGNPYYDTSSERIMSIDVFPKQSSQNFACIR